MGGTPHTGNLKQTVWFSCPKGWQRPGCYSAAQLCFLVEGTWVDQYKREEVNELGFCLLTKSIKDNIQKLGKGPERNDKIPPVSLPDRRG